jgi:glyoxylase-like metal-dependent hydrolase (beta-lactamase superfamily II)
METVLIENFFPGCLAHASCLVGSQGIAAVIDPQRDVDIYIGAAREKGLRIGHIVETHLHADFVSGHHELAERTGATFPHVAVKDGDSIQFGNSGFDEFCHSMPQLAAIQPAMRPARKARRNGAATQSDAFEGDCILWRTLKGSTTDDD